MVPSAPRPETAGALPHLFVVGDSISLHYGPYLEEAVRGRFAYSRKGAEPEGAVGSGTPSLEYPHGPFGENAGDVTMVLAYLATRPAAVDSADVLLLNCGLHDLKVSKATGRHQVPLGTYRDTLTRIVRALAHSRARLVWCTTTPVDDLTHARHGYDLAFTRCQEDVLRYNATATGVMTAAAVPVIDLHAHTLSLAADGYPAGLYVDHAHFTATVRAAQAGFIADWLGARFTDGAT